MKITKAYQRKRGGAHVDIEVSGDPEKVKELEKAIEECYESWKGRLDWEEI